MYLHFMYHTIKSLRSYRRSFIHSLQLIFHLLQSTFSKGHIRIISPLTPLKQLSATKCLDGASWGTAAMECWTSDHCQLRKQLVAFFVHIYGRMHRRICVIFEGGGQQLHSAKLQSLPSKISSCQGGAMCSAKLLYQAILPSCPANGQK